jgi:hypothetical protein
MPFVLANPNNPEQFASAVQEAIISSMESVLNDLKKELKTPGLTWEQLDYFLAEYKKKIPTIITQEHEQ